MKKIFFSKYHIITVVVVFIIEMLLVWRVQHYDNCGIRCVTVPCDVSFFSCLEPILPWVILSLVIVYLLTTLGYFIYDKYSKS